MSELNVEIHMRRTTVNESGVKVTENTRIILNTDEVEQLKSWLDGLERKNQNG